MQTEQCIFCFAWKNMEKTGKIIEKICEVNGKESKVLLEMTVEEVFEGLSFKPVFWGETQ
jgi:hypothetical protein